MKSSLALGALTALAGISSAIELNPTNFDEIVFGQGKNAFVKFQAPWWGHCKRMKPAWDELSKIYESSASVVIGDVDCTQHKELCTQHEVRGYPTLGYFKDGAKKKEKYSGARDVDALKKFVEENLVKPGDTGASETSDKATSEEL